MTTSHHPPHHNPHHNPSNHYGTRSNTTNNPKFIKSVDVRSMRQQLRWKQKYKHRDHVLILHLPQTILSFFLKHHVTPPIAFVIERKGVVAAKISERVVEPL
ncbi:hypothetical protein AAZX31_14G194700 [Glycine max]